jgi:hypothetical protein
VDLFVSVHMWMWALPFHVPAASAPSIVPMMDMFRVGQNHIYIQCMLGSFGQVITKYTVDYIRCIYMVLANSRHVASASVRA